MESKQLGGDFGSGVSVADPEVFNFAMVGDLHIGGQDTTRFRRMLSQARAEGDSFIILLGDMVDQGEREDYVAFLAALGETGWQGKFFPVVGNHDIFEGGWNHYKELLGPSHYTFQVGNAKFIVVDTADATVGEDQRDWLVSELGKPRPTHVFLVSHYLPVIPGQRTYLKLANEAEALETMKLCTIHGVSGWFGAHYHSFSVGRIENVDYVVAGGGGGRRMDPIHENFFVRVRISGNNVSYQLRIVE